MVKNLNLFTKALLMNVKFFFLNIWRPSVPVHYAEVGDIQQGLGLPGKASLWAKNAFSSTVLKIWSLVCTRFPETNMLSVQKLEPEFGHNS